MLSFDYTPQFCQPSGPRALGNLIRNSINPTPDFFAPSRESYHCGAPRRIVRSRSYFPQHYHQPRSTGFNDEFGLHGLINSLIQHGADDYEIERKPEVGYKVLRSKNQYQIHINKSNDELDDYSIRYKVIGGSSFIEVESAKDDFKKVFKFNQNEVDITDVKWKIDGNVLKVIVPRVQERVAIRPHIERVFAPVEDQSRFERSASVSPKPTSKAQQKQQKPSESISKAKVVSIPIEYEDSETETEVTTPRSSRSNSVSETESISTKSRSDSEAGLSSDEQEPLHKLPKLKRRVSIEEVEDESIHL